MAFGFAASPITSVGVGLGVCPDTMTADVAAKMHPAKKVLLQNVWKFTIFSFLTTQVWVS